LALLSLASAIAPSPSRGAETELQKGDLRIGLLESSGPLAEDLAQGAKLAVEELNASGGVDGRRIELFLLPRSRGPWRDGAPSMAELVYEKELVALIGPTTRTGAHLAAQIATKKGIPVVTLSFGRSITRVMDPWVFRGVPEDDEQARALLRWAFSEPEEKRAVLVVPEGRDGEARLGSLERACAAVGARITGTVRASKRMAPDLGGIDAVNADAIFLWLDVESALLFLRSQREILTGKKILGSLRLDNEEFMGRAPSSAEGLALPMLRSDSGVTLGSVLGYDMVHVIATAAKKADGRPELIRDNLLGGEVCSCRSGEFHFDEFGNRRGSFPIGTLRRGNLLRSGRPTSPVPD
jgi:branched-chain amino acid transport system substrate-binding protein